MSLVCQIQLYHLSLELLARHYDFALFLNRIDGDTILLFLYVDDMIITGHSGIQEFKDFLS